MYEIFSIVTGCPPKKPPIKNDYFVVKRALLYTSGNFKELCIDFHVHAQFSSISNRIVTPVSDIYKGRTLCTYTLDINDIHAQNVFARLVANSRITYVQHKYL